MALNKLLRIPQDQSLIYFLIEKQNNPLSQILGLIGFIALFWLAFQNPWSIIAMIVGMYLHELGHFFLFRANGIKSIILFIFPLGAVAAPINKEEDKGSDLLPWWHLGWLLLAGVIMNLLLMFFGLGLIYLHILPELGYQMIYINGVLIIFNLLPIAKTDGGQLFHLIFSSLPEKYDTVVSLTATIITIFFIGGVFLAPLKDGGLSLIYSLFQNFSPLAFLLLMIIGIWNKQGKDNSAHSQSSQAMTKKQVIVLLSCYICLVASTLFLMSFI